MWKILRRFYSFVFKYKFYFIAATFFFTILALLKNIVPIILRNIINAVQAGRYDEVINSLIILLALNVGMIVVQPLAMICNDWTFFRSAKDARVKIFDHLHKLDFAYHTKKSSGSMISIFRRGEGAFMNFYDALNWQILTILLNFTFMIFVFASLYPKMIIVSLFVFVANVAIMFYTLRRNVAARKRLNNFEDNITGVTVDNMTAFDTVKYFANESYESKRLDKLTDRWCWFGMDYANSFRLINLTNGVVINFGYIAVIVLGVIDLMNGQIGFGDFIMATSFAAMFFPNMDDLLFRIRDLAKSYVDFEKYLSVLDEPVLVKEIIIPSEEKKLRNLNSGEHTIEFKDIVFSYEGNGDVLQNVSFKIKAGESVAFVGKSGAGKTTITKLLMRFYDPQKGKILVGDVDIASVSKEALRRKIGIVPQETVLFNDTIGYNIAYGRDEFTMKDLEDACRAANLNEFIDTLPAKFMTEVGERGIKLSGGQKQRLSIARVFLENAPIIVFDEATSNLDSESERLIQEAFWNLAKNKTTIIIAHRLSTIQKVDRIIVFDNGKVIEEGNHKELAHKDSGIYKHLWELQTNGEIE